MFTAVKGERDVANTPIYRDTWVEINLDSISSNVQNMRKHLPSGVQIMAVVKANAYGHGAKNIAKIALESGATSLAVAFLDEALSLRKAGIQAPILVLGWVRPQDINVAAKHSITLTVFQPEWISQAADYYDGDQDVVIPLHIKVDTGMGRIGLRTFNELQSIVEEMKQHTFFKIEGVYTHFATADECELDYFNHQYDQFKQIISWLHDRNIEVNIIHCGNSATGLRFPDKLFNAIRFGIAMYGLEPSAEIKNELPFPLKESFSLHSKLIHVKRISAGERISYGATYEAKEEEWIGTVPIGYADGWVRKLSETEVLINGERAPIVGRVCMDQLMVKIPHYLPIGSKVTLIGRQNNEWITVDEIASRLSTINYEVTCMISSRVPRMFLKNKSIIEVNNPLQQ
jgi:alanine racemase